MPESKGGRGGDAGGVHWNPTQKLDQSLAERYRKDPEAFARSTQRNLLVALALLVFAGILVFASLKWVGLSQGGLALDTMALFPFLLALADLDDVRWRRALVARKGVPLPPRPPIRQFLHLQRAPAAKGPARES